MRAVHVRIRIPHEHLYRDPKDIEHRWFIVDADGMVLGRLATEIVRILRGKHKPMYTPHMDTGDNVIVINASKIKLTGRKMEQKRYFTHTGYMGHERFTPRRPCWRSIPSA
jgi:large subunit ribosomal protein L13